MKDNRQGLRIYFSAEDGVNGELKAEGNGNETFPARILNLSEGGIGLSLDAKTGRMLQKGDRLVLNGMSGIGGSLFTDAALLEVAWILNHEGFDHVGAGCSFILVSVPDMERIRTFIDSY